MIRGESLVTPERTVGLLGGLLLVCTYAALAVFTEFQSFVGFGPREITVFAVPAFFVGGVVAVAADRFVPPERLDRSGHVRAVLTMMVAPGTVLALGVALFASLIWFSADLLDRADQLTQQVSGLGGLFSVIAAIVLIIAAIILLAILIGLLALLVVLGAVLQIGAALGYGVTTLALDRLGGEADAEAPSGEPPD